MAMPVPPAQFRNILSSFPSGVAVITARAPDGALCGLTSTAVCSLSADPPMLLVCLNLQSRTLPAVRSSGGFVVNFLAEGRSAISAIFASKEPEKYAGLNWQPSEAAAGAPILVEDVVAFAECRLMHEYQMNDHCIMIGRVDGGSVEAVRPLMYYRRQYGTWPDQQEETGPAA
jgi:flavin reductase (DIM6/NTAB) family NADH-FMN oxidoreductase RutF